MTRSLDSLFLFVFFFYFLFIKSCSLRSAFLKVKSFLLVFVVLVVGGGDGGSNDGRETNPKSKPNIC